MKKLILILLLFIISPVQANNLKDVNIQFVDDIDKACTVEQVRGCYIPEYKQIYIRKSDKNIPFVLFHEICHHLERNIDIEYQGIQEEYECNVFGLWATGYDISGEDEAIKKKMRILISFINDKKE